MENSHTNQEIAEAFGLTVEEVVTAFRTRERVQRALHDEKPKDRLLTPAEVATEMRVATGTVYRWISAGRIRYRKVGHSIRIPESEVRACQNIRSYNS